MNVQPFKTSITASTSYQLGDPILMTFEIENIGSETYQLLIWGTPLEQKIRGDFLILQRNGERIPYDGVFIKRGDPTPQSYVLLGPGEKLKETIDISTAYPIHETGDYTAISNIILYDVFSVAGTAMQAPRLRSQFEPHSLDPSTVQFKVVTSGQPKLKPRLTSGELAREAEKQAKKSPKAKGPSFNGGTPAQQADTITAHNNAQYFAALAASQLNIGPASTNALYQTWFGAFDQSRYDSVNKHFTDIANMLSSEQVTYDFTGSNPTTGDSCAGGDYAFTYPGVRTVWICSSYLSAAQFGTDCKFGTLIHEWSHAVCGTHCWDIYGETNALNMANTDPGKAVNHADNYEYFAEHLAQSDFGKSFTFITDRNTFGRDEIDTMLKKPSPAKIPKAFYIVADGYWADLLGITTSSLGTSPNVKPNIPSPVSGMTVDATSLEAEDDSLPISPQRFTWTCQIEFKDISGFPANPGLVQTLTLTATLLGHSCSAQIRLIYEPNPYEWDGQTSWLSTDLRVFQIQAGKTRFGETIGSMPADASTFIKKVVENLNAKTGGETFDSISTDQETSWLELSEKVNGTNVFNFAIAKVRYRGSTPISDVRVFFRLFRAESTSTNFDLATTYHRSPQGTTPIPLLGLNGSGDVITIPCFANPRVDSSAFSIVTQSDGPTNVRQIVPDPGGNEAEAYFGCWLDFNQTRPQFPEKPSPSDGPWTSGRKSIQELMRNAHQCLVAEIAFDPDPIPAGSSPADSDKLAQRNLAITKSANPGYEASRRILTTFDLHPIAGSKQLQVAPDELLIEWGNTPRNSIATIHIPEVDAGQIVAIANARSASHMLTQVDDHTIQLAVGGISYVPLPPRTASGLTGLLSIDLPDTVHKGDVYTIVVRQVTDAAAQLIPIPIAHKISEIIPATAAMVNLPQWRRIIGSYQVTIPVSTKEEMLPREVRLLSNLRWIQKAMSENDRWFPVFNRYVGQIADRVDALGGDSSIVYPSPSGEWQGGASGRCRLWKMINAVVLAALIAMLGTMSGVAVLAMAVLLAVVAYLWWTQCQPMICSLIRALLGGAGIGALILLLLMLLGVSSPQLVTVLAAAVVLAAIAGVVGFARHCF